MALVLEKEVMALGPCGCGQRALSDWLRDEHACVHARKRSADFTSTYSVGTGEALSCECFHSPLQRARNHATLK